MNTNMSTNRSPLAYFLLVFAISTPFSLLGRVLRLELLPGLPLTALVVTFCPMIAALILVYKENKFAGMIALLKRVFDYGRIKTKAWYLPVILLTPVVMLLEFELLRWMRSPIPFPQFPILAQLIMFITFFITSSGEELGWMGYAIDPMQERLGALKASILLGFAWAAWHIVPTVLLGRSPTWIAWQFLFWVALRVLFVWLYNNTGKSVFVATVYHAMLNITWQLFPINGSYYDPRITGLIVALAAVIVIALWGPKTLAQCRYSRS